MKRKSDSQIFKYTEIKFIKIHERKPGYMIKTFSFKFFKLFCYPVKHVIKAITNHCELTDLNTLKCIKPL